jgi:hypothetical protein
MYAAARISPSHDLYAQCSIGLPAPLSTDSSVSWHGGDCRNRVHNLVCLNHCHHSGFWVWFCTITQSVVMGLLHLLNSPSVVHWAGDLPQASSETTLCVTVVAGDAMG